MPCYSSDEFFRDWRYAVAKEFTTTEGEPFPYAENGSQEWGDEIRKLSFGADAHPHDACLSTDSSRLAVAVANNIHVIDTADWTTKSILRGHLTRVSALEFKPHDANVLISSDEQDYGRVDDPAAKPTIIVWRLDKVREMPALTTESLGVLSTSAAAIAAVSLADMGVQLDGDELKELETSFAPGLTRVVTKRLARDYVRLSGRLQTSFQSKVFSPSGKYLAYMPDGRPRSNRVDEWNVKICRCGDDGELGDHLTLEGHTDAIMWIGFNAEESLIGTVAWDKTARIWDAQSGEAVHVFRTSSQNWAGGFSPDGHYFAATCGDGSLGIYSLADGSTFLTMDAGAQANWKRALDWHPNGKSVAVAARRRGGLVLLDVEKNEVAQERILSAEASMPDDEEVRDILAGWPEVSEVRFVDEGRKLAVWAVADDSAEVYDLERQVKWRFARGGTGDGPKSLDWRDDKGKVTSKGGWGMLVDMASKERLRVFSIDHDAVRVWLGPVMGASG